MTDLLLELGKNARARKLVESLGLPIPIPQTLRRASGPWEARALEGMDVLFGAAPRGAMAAPLSDLLAPAGANVHVVADDAATRAFREAGEAFGRAVTAIGAAQAAELRPHALVFDATGIDDPSSLRALYDFFHPWIGRLARNGRAVVIARAPEGAGVATAAARNAVDGFVRSLAKEIGRKGATANLVVVEDGAERRAVPVVGFVLSKRSAFVDGQPIRVSARAKGADAPRLGVRALDGKVALVTGAARGIGAATARILAAEGAKVVCLDRPADDGPTSALARELHGGAILLDIADPSTPKLLAEELRARFGGVDVVVHNAGVTRDRTLGRMSEAEWDQALAINLAAVVRTTDALLDGVLHDGGRVVALSSIAGIAGNVGQTNYSASKAGVVGFVRALAPTLAARGVTVNAVAPGFIETRLTDAIPIAIREAARRMSSLGQGGQPQDVGEVIAFLASPASIGITGQVVRVCGQSLVGA